MTRYCLAGVTIDSEIDLPLPELATTAREAEVSLSVGPTLGREEAPLEIGWNWKSSAQADLGYPDLGKAWVSEGNRILLRPCRSPADVPTEWRGMIIPCFAALFHQRGALPLHASAVRIGEIAVGFMASSGAGKSTLVAQLVESCADFICDDLLLLDETHEQGDIRVATGLWIIKLWEEAVQVAGESFKRIGRLYPDATKDGFRPSEEISWSGPFSLRCIFILEEGPEVRVEALSKREAIVELLRHTYGAGIFDQKPLAPHFRQCGELAAKVSLKRLIRPKDFGCAEEVEHAILAALPPAERAESMGRLRNASTQLGPT